jgi:predicted RNase H-like nuclease (RuvC/YqgF family)
MDIHKAIKEIRQSRSRYQLEKFVIGQHHSPEMQYYQLTLEAAGLISTIKETELRIRKIQAECEELRETGKKSDAIEADIKELSLEDLELHLIGSRRELEHLKALFEDFPKFTREEIEAAQGDYWQTRLSRVAEMQMLSRQSGIDWAQIEAIYQTGNLPQAMLTVGSMQHLNAPKIDYITLEEKAKK